MKTTVEIGKTYALRSEAGGEVTDVDGKTLDTLEPNKQVHMTAQESEWLVPDDCKVTKTTFNYALAVAGLLGGGADKLPPGYTRLAYLQGTGTQYINTGAAGNENSEVLCTFERTTAEGKCVYAVPDVSTGMNNLFVWGNAMEYLRYDWGAKNYGAKNAYPGGMVTLIQSPGGVTVNGVQVLGPFPAESFQISNFLLFSHKASASSFMADNVRMARWALKTDGKPVRDMVPALDPAGTPCMYDRVTRTAYKRSGSGQYIAGVGTVAQLTTLLRRLPATGGELTLSLPAEANTPEVAEQLQACHDTKGWTLTVDEYRPAAVATYSLRRMREVIWCRKEQSEYGCYVAADGTRWQVERCAAIFGEYGNAPSAYGYEPFDSVEQAVEAWGLVPYVEPETEENAD